MRWRPGEELRSEGSLGWAKEQGVKEAPRVFLKAGPDRHSPEVGYRRQVGGSFLGMLDLRHSLGYSVKRGPGMKLEVSEKFTIL